MLHHSNIVNYTDSRSIISFKIVNKKCFSSIIILLSSSNAKPLTSSSDSLFFNF